ncbi:microcin C transport system substrate-binding protein [Marinospirillum celere]|uniref:Microcin C transport system substrate-binding protein n=1 Tax=Marinospirillum celere TaxID=1122252 RepID=A0A1I1EEI4_9GAMM|nr:extracellular solute-binding protein [Marinospirillum celere]SFB85541.1 microcin C transport system substrate-binding protein [Marinospirillum celere]
MPETRLSFIGLKGVLTPLLFFGLIGWTSAALAEECVPALALHGEPKYPADFEHLDYVNPNAPKGGRMRQATLGTFDSLNPFIIQGTPATGLGNLYDSLTYNTSDEPFTEYGLLAKCMRLDAEGKWIEFQLREEARFNDGQPVTAEDVAFTFERLRTQGRPFYRAYYADITEIEVLDSQRIRFQLGNVNNRELPLIIGQVPILPKHYWEDRDFRQATLEKPVGSGPYEIAEVDPGRRIVYQRVEDYWGADLPVNRGRHNIDRLVVDYYRDATVALEAFKAGRLDFRLENIARNWAEGYSGPALSRGDIVLESIPHENSSGMQGFFFNTRKDVFKNPKVRLALTQLFDFEWTNQQLFHNAYTRTLSYYSNSELAAEGLPEGKELELLETFRDQLPESVFTTQYTLPETDGSGNIRAQMRKALSLLNEAGWTMEGRRLVNSEGQQLRFEILLHDSSFERVVLPWRQNLERVGIRMDVRVVDVTQYLNRLREFDFDMTVSTLGQSLSPGNEQREYFHSEFAQASDGRNLSGIEDPVVDALVEKLISAKDRDTLIQTTRALDRVLLHGHYVIPHWHLNEYRVARHKSIQIPEVRPPYGLPTSAWWVEE